jgi:uncharacterized protein YegP (UPF0339 family)
MATKKRTKKQTAPKRNATVLIYQDKKKGWRWRLVANGNIMADSAESYTRRRAARRAWDRFVGYVSNKKFHTFDGEIPRA